jgi:hypothetical protein
VGRAWLPCWTQRTSSGRSSSCGMRMCDGATLRRSAAVASVRLRQGPNQRSSPSTCLRTPRMGSGEAACRVMRAGLGQTLWGRANRQARGTRARRGREQLAALGFGPIGALVPAATEVPVLAAEAGAPVPGDEMSRASAVRHTSAPKCCCDSDSRLSRNRGEDLRG